MAAMASWEFDSVAAEDSTNLERGRDSDGKYAMTLPFPLYQHRCEYSLHPLLRGSGGCKGCEAASVFAKSRPEMLEQTKKRWAWFLEAGKLDDECSTRLGTFGYLPWKIRADPRIDCAKSFEHPRVSSRSRDGFTLSTVIITIYI